MVLVVFMATFMVTIGAEGGRMDVRGGMSPGGVPSRSKRFGRRGELSVVSKIMLFVGILKSVVLLVVKVMRSDSCESGKCK